MEVKGHDVRAHDAAGRACASAALPGIYENFPGYRDATQFSGIFPEIPGWLVRMHYSEYIQQMLTIE